jgi:hypothetical protein
LTNGVIAALVLPFRLLGGNTLNRYADRHEPIFLVVSGTKGFQQRALQRLRLLRLPLHRHGSAKRKNQDEYGFHIPCPTVREKLPHLAAGRLTIQLLRIALRPRGA